MSSRKRRKISTSVEGTYESLKTFRLQILETLTSNRPPDGFDTWGEYFNCEGFEDLNDDEKIRISLLETNQSAEKRLSMGMNVISFHTIRSFFKRHFDDPEIKSKNTMCECLIAKYFEKSHGVLKRGEEKDNLEESDLVNVFMEISGMSIPRDVILEILSYLPYDSNLLFKVGKVCKTLYLTILSSWKSVSVSKSNLYEISLVIYQSVEKIRIVENSNKEKLITSEVEYILKCLSNNNKLRKITFQGNISLFIKNIKIFHKFCVGGRKKKKKNQTKIIFNNNVNILKISIPLKLEVKTLGQVSKSKVNEKQKISAKIQQLFPSLHTFENPWKFEFLEDLKTVKNLKIKRNTSKWLRPIHSEGPTRTKLEHTLKNVIYPWKKFSEYDYHHSIQSLELHTTPDDEETFLNQVLPNFKNLEKLELHLDFIGFNRGSKEISLSCFEPNSSRFLTENSSRLKELKISTYAYLPKEYYVATRCSQPQIFTKFFDDHHNVISSVSKLEIHTNKLIKTCSALIILKHWDNTLRHLRLSYEEDPIERNEQQFEELMTLFCDSKIPYVHIEKMSRYQQIQDRVIVLEKTKNSVLKIGFFEEWAICPSYTDPIEIFQPLKYKDEKQTVYDHLVNRNDKLFSDHDEILLFFGGRCGKDEGEEIIRKLGEYLLIKKKMKNKEVLCRSWGEDDVINGMDQVTNENWVYLDFVHGRKVRRNWKKYYLFKYGGYTAPKRIGRVSWMIHKFTGTEKNIEHKY